MNAYKCDRCGEFHKRKWTYLLDVRCETPKVNRTYNSIHICPKCMALIKITPEITDQAICDVEAQTKDERPNLEAPEEIIKEEENNENESVNS